MTHTLRPRDLPYFLSFTIFLPETGAKKFSGQGYDVQIDTVWHQSKFSCSAKYVMVFGQQGHHMDTIFDTSVKWWNPGPSTQPSGHREEGRWTGKIKSKTKQNKQAKETIVSALAIKQWLNVKQYTFVIFGKAYVRVSSQFPLFSLSTKTCNGKRWGKNEHAENQNKRTGT